VESDVLKLLILFPLMLVGGALGLAVLLPVLAILPLMLAAGAGILAFVLVFAVLGLCLRLVFGLLIGAGALFIGALGFGALFAGGAVLLALGFALAHVLLPVLLIVGLIWLIRRGSRPPAALPAP
jgi:hypothetical protein